MASLFFKPIGWLILVSFLWVGPAAAQSKPPSQETPCQKMTVMQRLATIAEGSKANLTRTVKTMRSLICRGSDTQNLSTYRWPSGQTVNLGENWYYPNGTTAKVFTTWYYPNSRILGLGPSQWYYPTGQIAKSGSTWYYPNGLAFNPGQIQPQNPSQENFDQDLQMLEHLWGFQKR